MSSVEADIASPDKELIREFFDQISPRYDRINDILSFRLDARWRKRSLDILLDGAEQSVLDLGTGTGKFLELCLKRQNFKQSVGLDFSSQMLAQADAVLPQAEFVGGDFHHLPFAEERFDLVISSFALRSVKEMDSFFSEVYRVLKPGGKAGFLCLTRPHNRLLQLLYYPYLNFYLPVMGRFLSGHRRAYDFLSQSIQHFQEPTKTLEWMKRSGFESVRLYSFTFGSATLYVGRK